MPHCDHPDGARKVLFTSRGGVVLAIGSQVEIIKYDAWRREAQLPDEKPNVL